MVGGGELREPKHARGLQRAHERPIGHQQEDQQEERQVQGRRGVGGDHTGRTRRCRIRPKHQGRGPRDRPPRLPPREAALLAVGAAPTGLAGAQAHDLVQEVRQGRQDQVWRRSSSPRFQVHDQKRRKRRLVAGGEALS